MGILILSATYYRLTHLPYLQNCSTLSQSQHNESIFPKKYKATFFSWFPSTIYSSFFVTLVNSQLLANMYQIHLQSKTYSFSDGRCEEYVCFKVAVSLICLIDLYTL